MILDYQIKCYDFYKINYDDAFLQYVDVTYILYLEGNNRFSNIMKQLNDYHPTNLVYIVSNKGYKKCDKGTKIIFPSIDLVYSYIKIFEHAKINNYNNILILEDDFIFNPIIKNEFTINNVNNFLYKFKNKKFIYALGCFPIIQIPYDFYNSKILFFTLTHSLIYNKQIYNEIIQDYYNEKLNIMFDEYISHKFYNFSYMYNIPLCYQIFGDTDNSKYWHISDFKDHKKINRLRFLYVKIILFFRNLLKLNYQPEPGFTIIYTFSKILFLFLILILLLLIEKIILLSNNK